MNYDYISSYKIARNCDVVFSEVVTPNQFIRLDIKNYSIIYENSRQVFYKLDSFKQATVGISKATYFPSDSQILLIVKEIS